jgi:hypothetical protein
MHNPGQTRAASQTTEAQILSKHSRNILDSEQLIEDEEFSNLLKICTTLADDAKNYDNKLHGYEALFFYRSAIKAVDLLLGKCDGNSLGT